MVVVTVVTECGAQAVANQVVVVPVDIMVLVVKGVIHLNRVARIPQLEVVVVAVVVDKATWRAVVVVVLVSMVRGQMAVPHLPQAQFPRMLLQLEVVQGVGTLIIQPRQNLVHR
jgi:hypothetical protein